MISDRYGAVVRSPGAYIPPGARAQALPLTQSQAQAQAAQLQAQTQANTLANAAPSIDITPSPTIPSIPTITKQEGAKSVTIVAPDTSSSVSPVPPVKVNFRSFLFLRIYAYIC